MNELRNLFYDEVSPKTQGSISLRASELAALVKLVGKFKVPVLLDTRKVLPPDTIEPEPEPYIKVVMCMGGGAAFAVGYGEEAIEITLESGIVLMREMHNLNHGLFGEPF